MKSTTKIKMRTARPISLAARLTAYSIMASAALAVMPAADGAIVHTNHSSVLTTPIYEGFVQGQQVRSQKVRHHRQPGMHVLASTACSSSSSSTGSGAGE